MKNRKTDWETKYNGEIATQEESYFLRWYGHKSSGEEKHVSTLQLVNSRC